MNTENLLTKSTYSHHLHDPEYKGEAVDPKLAHGPTGSRRCTDVICCFAFLLAIGLFGFVSVVNMSQSDPLRIISTEDSVGNVCGDGDAAQYPYLYLANITEGINRTVCIKDCPDNSTSQIDYYPNQLFSDGTVEAMSTFPLFNRICIPTQYGNNDVYSVQISKLFKEMGFLKFFADIENSPFSILSAIGIAVLASILYNVLLRFCAKVIGWGLIALMILGVAGLGVFLYLRAKVYEEEGDTTTADTYTYGVYGCAIVEVIMLIILVTCLSRIRVAISVVAAAADFVTDTIQILFLPFIFFILKITVFLFGIFVLACLVSKATKDPNPDSDDWFNPFSSYSMSVDQKIMMGYIIFGTFWLVSFLMALNQFVIAHTVSIWYFSEERKAYKGWLITRSFKNALVFHLGTLAIGSLILAIVWVIQLLISVVYVFQWDFLLLI